MRRPRSSAGACSFEGVVERSTVLQRRHSLDVRPDRIERRGAGQVGADLGSCPADRPGRESLREAGVEDEADIGKLPHPRGAASRYRCAASSRIAR